MTAQSAAMAQAFGTFYQYGKRKISSMTNEEFNALTPQTLFQELTADVRGMIPNMKSSMDDMSALQDQVIREIARIVPKLPTQTTAGLFEGFKDIVGDISQGIDETFSTQQAFAAGTAPPTVDVQKTVLTPETLPRNIDQFGNPVLTPTQLIANQRDKELKERDRIAKIEAKFTQPEILSRANQAIINSYEQHLQMYKQIKQQIEETTIHIRLLNKSKRKSRSDQQKVNQLHQNVMNAKKRANQSVLILQSKHRQAMRIPELKGKLISPPKSL